MNRDFLLRVLNSGVACECLQLIAYKILNYPDYEPADEEFAMLVAAQLAGVLAVCAKPDCAGLR